MPSDLIFNVEIRSATSNILKENSGSARERKEANWRVGHLYDLIAPHHEYIRQLANAFPTKIMQQIIFSVPVLPGKKQVLKDFVKEITGPKWAEYSAANKRYGVQKETWFLQSSPQGDWVMVYWEADDITKIFQEFGASTAPLDVWLREKLKEVSGIDYSQPSDAPPPEQLLKYG